jgi:hypothetical protein
MAAAERHDISTYASSTFNPVIVVCDNEEAPIDITGYTAEMVIKDKQAGTTIATLTVGSGITITGATGTVSIKRTPAQVQAWKLDKGFYELKLINGSSEPETIMQGELEVVTL